MAVRQGAQPLRQPHHARASVTHRPLPGRPPRLTAAQWPHLRPRLTQGALRAGVEPARWTWPRLRAWLVVACGVTSQAHAVARRLKARRGASPGARRRGAGTCGGSGAGLASPGVAAEHHKARRTSAARVVVDETGGSCRATVATTGVPSGQTPSLRRRSQRRERPPGLGLPRSGTLDQRPGAPALGAAAILALRPHVPCSRAGSRLSIWGRWRAPRGRPRGRRRAPCLPRARGHGARPRRRTCPRRPDVLGPASTIAARRSLNASGPAARRWREELRVGVQLSAAVSAGMRGSL